MGRKWAWLAFLFALFGAVAGFGIGNIVVGLIDLVINADAIPAAFGLVFTHAFSPVAATGGFAGAAVAAAIRFGVARGVFSNEAGLGSAPIAHAAATTKDPVRQGSIAMLGTFIDTIVVCSITGLAIISSGVRTTGVTGAPLTAAAFEAALPGVGSYLVDRPAGAQSGGVQAHQGVFRRREPPTRAE